jgi:hypothetical protein
MNDYTPQHNLLEKQPFGKRLNQNPTFKKG